MTKDMAAAESLQTTKKPPGDEPGGFSLFIWMGTDGLRDTVLFYPSPERMALQHWGAVWGLSRSRFQGDAAEWGQQKGDWAEDAGRWGKGRGTMPERRATQGRTARGRRPQRSHERAF